MQVLSTDSPGFLAGGGEMGALIRAKDWSETPLGPPETWPQSLRTAVSIMLDTHFGMQIAWGEDYLQLYNDGYRPVLGRTKHPAALGAPIREFFPEIWESFVKPKFDAVMWGEPFGAENMLVPQDRNNYLEEGYFTFSYSPIRDESGRVGGVLTTETETTEHVIRERRLVTSRAVANRTSVVGSLEEAGRVLMEVLRENPYDLPFALLYILDPDAQQARRVEYTGLTNDAIASPVAVDLTTADSGSWPLAEVLKTGAPLLLTDLPARFGLLPGGAWPEPTHTAYLVPISRLDRTQFYGVLVFGVNPRRAFDEAMQGFFDSLAEQTTRIFATASALEEERRRNEALRELDQAKTLFFNNVSHEFRTPLTLMLGPLEEAIKANDQLPPAVHENLETAHRNALRLQKLVNTLLDFSRIEAGRMRATYAPTDLAALTADLTSAFRSAVERAGMELVVDCPPLPEPAYVDREMWEKIVLNLLSNAFKYTLEGRIAVSLSAENGQAVLRVTDTGVGIPPDELPRLFERFHRVAGSRGRTFEGTGIGLSLIRELVGLHGGVIEVNSEPGVGSTFTVRIPLGKEHLPAEHVDDRARTATPTAAVDSFLTEVMQLLPEMPLHPEAVFSEKKAHVLVVDDNADMRAYIQRLLEPHYRVSLAPDGQVARWLVAEHHPDLVLSDVMMPVMDGLELLQTLKADPQTATTPVILLSARAGEEAKIGGYDAGADDYLVKPFSANELLARVRSQLNMAQVRREAERQLQTIFEQAPVAICILRGPDLVVEMANATMYRLWRSNAERLHGRPLFAGLPEAAGAGFEELLAKVLAGETVTFSDHPFTLLDDDGAVKTFYGSWVYQPLHEPDGRIERILCVVQETTDSVLARQETEKSEQKLQGLFKQAPVGIALLRGPEHTFELANDFYVNFVGRQRTDEIVGKPLLAALPEIDGQGFFELLTQVVETGEAIVFTDRPVQLLRNGHLETGYFTFTYQPLPAPDSGVFVIAVEVTESVLARQKIEESENRLNLALDAAEMGTWEYDLRSGAITASERTAELHGLALGEPFSLQRGLETATEADRQRVADAVAIALQPQSGGNYSVEYTLSNSPDGQPRIVQAKGKAFFDETGKAYRLIGTALDVTEQKRADQALRESEEKYRTLFESIDEGFCIIEFLDGPHGPLSDYVHVEANPAYARHAGIPEVVGQRLRTMVPDEADEWLARYRPVLETGQPVRFEQMLVATSRHLELAAFRIEPPERRQVAVLFTDISERKRAEAALRESGTRFRQLADSMPQMVWSTLPDGYHDFYNQRWYDFTGLTYEQTRAEGWSRVLHPDDHDRAWTVWRESLKTGKIYEIEYRMRRHDGAYVWQLGRALPIRDDAGNIVRWYGTCTDIGEQKRAEAALRESDRWFRQLADSMPQIVWTARPDGYLDYYNRRWYEFIDNDLGFGDAGWLPILHPDDRQPCLDHWQHCLQTGEPYQFEFRLDDVRQPGNYRWFLARASAFRNEQNAILKWFGTCTDIHDQKTEAERQEKLVRERTHELQETNAELERSNYDLMQFASVASHDLKEPLRKIQAFGNLLTKRLDGKLDPGDRDYFGRIIGASNRMQALIEDVLSLSKLSSKDVAYVPVDLNATLARIVDDLEITIREKAATVRVGNLPRLDAVPGQMHQLFQNLLSNALKFNGLRPPEVSIEPVPLTPQLQAELRLPNAAYAVVEVRDNGIGFEAQYRERIFGMFQRLHGRAEYAGTGIGLTICRKIVENHHGVIIAEGEPGQGATFRVALPVRQDVENEKQNE